MQKLKKAERSNSKPLQSSVYQKRKPKKVQRRTFHTTAPRDKQSRPQPQRLTHWDKFASSLIPGKKLLGKDRILVETDFEALPIHSSSIVEAYINIHYDLNLIGPSQTGPPLHAHRGLARGASTLWRDLSTQPRQFQIDDFTAAVNSSVLRDPTYTYSSPLPNNPSKLVYPANWRSAVLSSTSIPLHITSDSLPLHHKRQMIHWNLHSRIANDTDFPLPTEELARIEKEIDDLKALHQVQYQEAEAKQEEERAKRSRKQTYGKPKPIITAAQQSITQKEIELQGLMEPKKILQMQIPEQIAPLLFEPWKHDMVRFDTLSETQTENPFTVRISNSFLITIPNHIEPLLTTFIPQNKDIQKGIERFKASKMSPESKKSTKEVLQQTIPNMAPLPILEEGTAATTYLIECHFRKFKFARPSPTAETRASINALDAFVAFLYSLPDLPHPAYRKAFQVPQTETNPETGDKQKPKDVSVKVYPQFPANMFVAHIFGHPSQFFAPYQGF